MVEPICGYLRPKIKEHIEAKGESLRWFSRQTDVDNSTIYRLVDGGQKSLSFTNAARIVKYLEPENYLSILSDFYPFESRELSKISPEKADGLLSILAADPYLYRVFVFAAEKQATREEVKLKFGEDGLEQLDKLINAEIISCEIGSVDNLKGMAYPSEDTAKKIAQHSYLLTSLSTRGTLLDNFRGAVSEEGALDIYQAGLEYRAKVHKTLDGKKGDIIVTGSLISGPME